MSTASEHATRARIIADTIEVERARIFGAAKNIAEQTNLQAALIVLDAAKLRLVRDAEDQKGWIA